MFSMLALDPRRNDPRISASSFCSELLETDLRHGLVVELSESGLRIERPFFGGRLGERVQLEFELPEIDEIVWAAAQPCYDVVSRRAATSPGELGGLVRTSGFRLVRTSERSRRLLRDLVFETRHRQESSFLLAASCYTRG